MCVCVCVYNSVPPLGLPRNHKPQLRDTLAGRAGLQARARRPRRLRFQPVVLRPLAPACQGALGAHPQQLCLLGLYLFKLGGDVVQQLHGIGGGAGAGDKKERMSAGEHPLSASI